MSAAALGWVVAIAPLCAALGYRARLRHCCELVSRACHELRSPLTAAGLALHAMARAGDVPIGRVYALDLELSRAGAALEDLAAARDGRPPADRLEAIDVGELLERTVACWAPAAQAHGCELCLGETSPGVLIRGDRVRLAQATGNLIANAIEHGRGPIELRARLLLGRVAIEVLDAGPGLPAPVAALAKRSRAGNGWRGRGLAIACDIAARHGGRVATGPARRGARVALELPAAGHTGG
ncbi:MAG: two-component system, OmpR family, sensor kinase [Solirubrobacteraceae bacterium]|nr:two-component system, OmpR family, sensor kinase [Solirubrobacteraceae bacterium]